MKKIELYFFFSLCEFRYERKTRFGKKVATQKQGGGMEGEKGERSLDGVESFFRLVLCLRTGGLGRR